jgi:hypothetical protein
MKTLADPAAGERLIARLERVTPEARRRWGTLTSAEMLCHLGDVARSVLGGGKPHPLKARPRPVMKWIALYSPIPWPKGRIRTPRGWILATAAHVPESSSATVPVRSRACAGWRPPHRRLSPRPTSYSA